MKDLLQKLREFLGLNNNPEIDDIPHKPEFHSDEIKPEVQVRTKSIYPREQQGAARFRFPVIPDDRTMRPTDRKVSEQRPMETIPSPAPTFKTEKKGFKPSEMISPVYGTKRPSTQPQGEDQVETQVIPQMLNQSVNEVVESPKADQPREEISCSSTLVNSKEVVVVDTELEKPAVAIQPIVTDQPIERPSTTGTAKVIAFPKKPTQQNASLSPPLESKPNQPAIITPVRMDPYPETAPVANQHATLPTRMESSQNHVQQTGNYLFPHIERLKDEPQIPDADLNFVDNQIDKLTHALENFNVSAEVVGVVKGPTVTRYELQPAPGVKVNKFTNLIDDIKLALAAKDIRMEAPIPGRSAIGIEVPNEVSSPVFIRSIIESEEFQQHPSPLAVALGRDIGGAPVIGDLKRMPHGLIAGSTGSGKSVCINSILVSLLYKAKPSEVRLILIDPKVVELAPYNHIPHLLTPVVTDPKQATAALKWAVGEMEKRYERFADLGVRDIDRYNSIASQDGSEKLPYIIIVIDELADLMMVSPHDVEESICRIAQKARACGIHLLLATQRPSVDVITGLIKANIPTRVAFAVSSQVDSRTILDMGGAERLLGKGDMLYYPSGLAKPVRLQGNFVSDDEIEDVVEHVKSQQKVKYLIDKEELSRSSNASGDCDDELFSEAVIFTIEQGQASSSSLQRRFRIGYNRAARLIDMMESEGFISGQSGSKPREVLITLEEYRQIFDGQ